MCVPGTQETVLKRLNRRDFLKSAGAAALALAAGAGGAGAAGAASAGVASIGRRTFRGAVDLTHTMWPDFPTYFGTPQLEIEELFNFADNGFNAFRWLLAEHTGTHMDAPFHFSDQDSADEIPVSKLVVPLAVVDIRRKARRNPDAQVTPDDLMAWEGRHGPIPAGACVAMNSGWASKVATDEFRNADANGVMHFPGFHAEAAAYLLGRDVNGIAVDTLSLDFGPSADFAVHYSWLPANRWCRS